MPSVSITARETKSGRRFVVRYRLGGRDYSVQHAGSFATLREARARRNLVAGELAAGRNPRPVLAALATPATPRTFCDVAKAWVESRHDVTAKQRAEYRHPLRLMIGTDALVDFGPRDPATIGVADVRDFVGKLAARYAPSTVRSYFTPLAMILDFAEVEPNPARHATIKLPARRSEEPVPITLVEFRAMLACLSPAKYVLPIRMLEATALRVGELVQLQWGDVDSRSSRLRISRTRTKGRTSGQRWAQVPLSLMDEVEALLPVEDRTAGRRVFVGLSESNVKQAMARACRHARIAIYSPHDLRHRRLSLWHGQGVPARVLAERAGHSRASISLDVYSHVIDPADDEWLA